MAHLREFLLDHFTVNNYVFSTAINQNNPDIFYTQFKSLVARHNSSNIEEINELL